MAGGTGPAGGPPTHPHRLPTRGASVALAMVLSAAGLARAQEMHADDLAAIEACVAEHRTGGQVAMEERCVGIVAGPCAETPQGQSTQGMNACFARESAAWDVLLNRVWPEMRARARAFDEANEVATLGLPSADQKLLASQRAWLTWREAECAARQAEWGAGTFGSNIHAFCWHELTARRTIALLDRVDDRGIPGR